MGDVPVQTLRIVIGLAVSACAAPQPAATTPESNGVSSAHASEVERRASSELVVVNHPPDFELDSLTGDTVRLGELVGKQVILLDFWATYCDPCLTAMPHLQSLYERYSGDGFTVLGISIDGPESVANVRSTVARLGVKFPILLDDESRVVAQYNPRTSAPFSVLIARDGRIVVQQEGFTTGNERALDDAIAKAVATSKQP